MQNQQLLNIHSVSSILCKPVMEFQFAVTLVMDVIELEFVEKI